MCVCMCVCVCVCVLCVVCVCCVLCAVCLSACVCVYIYTYYIKYIIQDARCIQSWLCVCLIKKKPKKGTQPMRCQPVSDGEFFVFHFFLKKICIRVIDGLILRVCFQCSLFFFLKKNQNKKIKKKIA
jgi:hypothetical protein